MKVCLAYDCLYPWTIGGAERWYRALAERLARDRHEVTYLTLRQWDRGEPPRLDGVRVIAVGPRLGLYTRAGRRRVTPPLAFGAGVLAHLARHGGRYDVIHLNSFPFFSLLAAGAVGTGRPLVVDWHEVWTREYWDSYLGRAGGALGWAVQARCARVAQQALCFSELHHQRLRALGVAGAVPVLRGLYAGPHAGDDVVREPERRRDPPTVVFAGRTIPEKQVLALVPALTVARRALGDLRLDIYGDGPQTPALRAAVATAGLREAVTVHGTVSPEALDGALRTAAVVVLPSRREGYGLVVVEAAARGCPSVVVDAPDSAATELVEDGVNGVLAASAEPEVLGAALARAVAGGDALRRSTAQWYARHAQELALESSLDAVIAAYGASARS